MATLLYLDILKKHRKHRTSTIMSTQRSSNSRNINKGLPPKKKKCACDKFHNTFCVQHSQPVKFRSKDDPLVGNNNSLCASGSLKNYFLHTDQNQVGAVAGLVTAYSIRAINEPVKLQRQQKKKKKRCSTKRFNPAGVQDVQFRLTDL